MMHLSVAKFDAALVRLQESKKSGEVPAEKMSGILKLVAEREPDAVRAIEIQLQELTTTTIGFLSPMTLKIGAGYIAHCGPESDGAPFLLLTIQNCARITSNQYGVLARFDRQVEHAHLAAPEIEAERIRRAILL